MLPAQMWKLFSFCFLGTCKDDILAGLYLGVCLFLEIPMSGIWENHVGRSYLGETTWEAWWLGFRV